MWTPHRISSCVLLLGTLFLACHDATEAAEKPLSQGESVQINYCCSDSREIVATCIVEVPPSRRHPSARVAA